MHQAGYSLLLWLSLSPIYRASLETHVKRANVRAFISTSNVTSHAWHSRKVDDGSLILSELVVNCTIENDEILCDYSTDWKEASNKDNFHRGSQRQTF